jgi:hypothetical protein
MLLSWNKQRRAANIVFLFGDRGPYEFYFVNVTKGVCHDDISRRPHFELDKQRHRQTCQQECDERANITASRYRQSGVSCHLIGNRCSSFSFVLQGRIFGNFQRAMMMVSRSDLFCSETLDTGASHLWHRHNECLTKVSAEATRYKG